MTSTHQFCSLLLAFHSFSFLKFFFQFFHFSFSLKTTNRVNVVMWYILGDKLGSQLWVFNSIH